MENKQEETKPLTKQELFAKEPDNFVHISELLIAIKSSKETGSYEILLNVHNPKDMGGYLFILQRFCNRLIDSQELKALQQRQDIKKAQGIIQKKNFSNFIRGKK